MDLRGVWDKLLRLKSSMFHVHCFEANAAKNGVGSMGEDSFTGEKGRSTEGGAKGKASEKRKSEREVGQKGKSMEAMGHKGKATKKIIEVNGEVEKNLVEGRTIRSVRKILIQKKARGLKWSLEAKRKN